MAVSVFSLIASSFLGRSVENSLGRPRADRIAISARGPTAGFPCKAGLPQRPKRRPYGTARWRGKARKGHHYYSCSYADDYGELPTTASRASSSAPEGRAEDRDLGHRLQGGRQRLREKESPPGGGLAGGTDRHSGGPIRSSLRPYAYSGTHRAANLSDRRFAWKAVVRREIMRRRCRRRICPLVASSLRLHSTQRRSNGSRIDP
jgi:hypothetical protein